MKKMIIYKMIAMFLVNFAVINLKAQCLATFHYESTGCFTIGRFSLQCDDSSYSFDALASAGSVGYANEPMKQCISNKGPIPQGNWSISLEKTNPIIFRLTPESDVETCGRSGFLIHGVNQGQSPQEASKGCIIIDKVARQMLYDAYIANGSKPISLQVIAIITGNCL